MRQVRWAIALTATAAAILAPAALAHVPTKKRGTRVVIHHVGVGASGRVTVTGIVKSKAPLCRSDRFVELRQFLPGADEILDIGESSFPGGAWAARPRAPAPDGARVFAKAERLVIDFSGVSNRKHRVVCKPSKPVRVALPS